MLDDITLIFDYYNDKPEFKINSIENGVITPDILSENENTYVFASHNHFDHFNKCIFDFQSSNDNIKYILDSDIKAIVGVENVNYLKKGEVYSDDLISVKAFDSTDIGISFLIKVKGMCIFHAGDLNFWHWKDEADDEYVQNEKDKFLAVTDEIEKENCKIDLMMFPVDYRMGDEGDIGSKMALEIFKPKMFVPMHFSNDFGKIAKFKKENSDNNIWDIKKRGDVLEYI